MRLVREEIKQAKDINFFEIYQGDDIQYIQVSKLSLFKDQTWDFSYMNTEKRSSRNALVKFKSIPPEFLFHIKTHALKQIQIDKMAFSTINKNIDVLKTISKELINRGLNNIYKLSQDVIKDYLVSKEKDGSFLYMEKLTNTLKSFIYHISETENINFDKLIAYLMKKQQQYGKHESKTTINDYIPDAFCNQLVSCAIKDSESSLLRLDERILACLIIILAETGMRAEEVSHLNTDRLHTYKISDNKSVNYLYFKSFKTIRGNGSELTYCYMTPLATNAYKLAEELVDQAINSLSEFVLMKRIYELITNQPNLRMKYLNIEQKSIINQLTNSQINDYKGKLSEFLFINSNTGKRRIGDAPLRENYLKFIIRNYETLNSVQLNKDETESLNHLQIKSKARYNKMYNVKYRKENTFEDTMKLKYPYVNLHRFRTTVCTKLFQQKVHIDFIIKHMNHISEDMSNYYNKSYELENKLEKSIEHIQGLIDDKGLLITNKIDVSEAYLQNELELQSSVEKIKKINKFLIERKLNVRKDVNEILNILKKTNSPAAENEFGMCMRSIIHSVCERRKYFHTFDDNYNLEINLDSYKFLNFEYERFKQKQEIVHYNKSLVEKNPEYAIEYDREIKALDKLVKEVIIKQLKSLNDDIDIEGEKKIIEMYPNLKEIVSNRKMILAEVRAWTNT